MTQFMWGALTIASWVIGLIFLRHWRASRDRLFAMFAAAFWLMGAGWAALAIENPTGETRHYFYLVRLAAFLVIIAAIIDKNRSPAGRK